jgi:NTP-dependent ternary system trypsin peptidase co-occuring protein
VGALIRIGLQDGGWLLVESEEPERAGPVQASRVTDAVQDLPGNLRTVLRSVTQASREVLAELRDAGPDEVKVEFGVKLTVAAGAVLTKGEASCHLKVTVGWSESSK